MLDDRPPFVLRAVQQGFLPLRRPGGPGPQGAGEERLPVIRLSASDASTPPCCSPTGCQVRVGRERLGHAGASATITLTVYQHVHLGMGREAADRFPALLEG